MITRWIAHSAVAVTALLLAVVLPCQTPTPYLVADLAPGLGAGDAEPSPGVGLNGQLVFFARATASAGWLPFVSDGTAAGTIQLSSTASVSRPLAARVGNRVIFGVELPDGSGDTWSTDGTTVGTLRILQGWGVRQVPDRWHGGAWIVFGASRSGRVSLFRTDGLVCAPTSLFEPSHLTAVTWQLGSLVRHVTFVAAYGYAGREPWVIESTPTGTSQPLLVADIASGTANGFAAPDDSTGFAAWVDPANSELRVAVVADDGATGTELRCFRRPFGSPSFSSFSTPEVAPGPSDADPRDLVLRGSDVFFSATNAAIGTELWRLSLASGQLTPFDLDSGPVSSQPRHLAALPSLTGNPLPDLWFQAEMTGPGRELWRFDGTAPTLLLDVNPLRNSSNPRVLGFADGRVFFAADNYMVGRELWRTDGTPAGTALVFDAVAGAGSSDPTLCGVVDFGGSEALLYSAQSPSGRELHRVVATTAAPELVRDLNGAVVSSNPRPILGWGAGVPPIAWADGRALFHASARSVWISDGTPANTWKLFEQPAPLSSLALLSGSAIAFDDGTGLFFAQQQLPSASAPPLLMVTDGTPGGTVQAAAVIAPEPQSVCYGLVELGGHVYFGVADNALASANGASAIWRTNRAGQAPQQVLGPAQGITGIKEWRVVGDRIFLAAARTDGSIGPELWAWQPPSAPVPVADIRPGPTGSGPQFLVPFRNRCFFTADDGVHGRELWASNGVGSGTVLVQDVKPGGGSGTFGPLVPLGASLVFVGDDGVHGREPWRANGPAAAQMIADLRSGPLGSSPGSITAVHVNVAACSADDGVHGRELWRVDTVGGGTLFDLRPGPVGSFPNQMVWSTRNLLFTADDGVHGREPWFASWIDFPSVAMLQDLAPGSASSVASPLFASQPVAAGTHVMFPATSFDGLTGTELFAVDMTASSMPIGTSCVQPFQTLELRSTAARVGQGLTYWAYDPGSNVPATTLMSLRPAAPGAVLLPGVACPVWVDPLTSVVVDSFTTPGNFVRTVQIPAAAGLLGTVLRMQVLLDYPPQLATNGLELVVGN